MSLESAEKLVERILRQMGIAYRLEPSPQGESPRIVADISSLSTLPEELHPYVTPLQPGDPGATAEDATPEGGAPPARSS